MPTMFISYRREDSSPYAGRLYDRLTQHFGKDRVFMDIDSLHPGDDFAEAIRQMVESCDVLIAIIGKNWLAARDASGQQRLRDAGDFLRLELTTALNRGIRIIPVLVGDAKMPTEDELPEDLRRLARFHAIMLPDVGFQASVSRLIEAVERSKQGGRRSQRTGPLGRWKEVTFIAASCMVFVAILLWYVAKPNLGSIGTENSGARRSNESGHEESTATPKVTPAKNTEELGSPTSNSTGNGQKAEEPNPAQIEGRADSKNGSSMTPKVTPAKDTEESGSPRTTSTGIGPKADEHPLDRIEGRAASKNGSSITAEQYNAIAQRLAIIGQELDRRSIRGIVENPAEYKSYLNSAGEALRTGEAAYVRSGKPEDAGEKLTEAINLLNKVDELRAQEHPEVRAYHIANCEDIRQKSLYDKNYRDMFAVFCGHLNLPPAPARN